MTTETLLQHFPEQPVPALIENFFRMATTPGEYFADFEPLLHTGENLATLLPENLHDRFMLIGQHASASLLVIWKASDSPADKLPIAWIDSEGDPNDVFAADFSQFLSLLPYGTGFIYDVIAKWKYYQEDPSNYQLPGKGYTPEKLSAQLEENRKEFPGLPKYEKWLANEAGLQTAADPVAMIGGAMKKYPGLRELVEKNR
jgi:hypothetical protein